MDETLLPMKRLFRQRAHCNPWSDHSFDYPLKPSETNWAELFEINRGSEVRVINVDIGCGYGGLLIRLANEFPEEYSVGMEIRLKVSDYVQEKIRALRKMHPGQYMNATCIRTNAMKFLVNYFAKGQLQRLFFLYPDPHFKKGKHKWRIITKQLLDMYAYVLATGGRIYAASDVPELAGWMHDCMEAHPLFRKICYVQLKTAFVQATDDAKPASDALQIVTDVLPGTIQNQVEFEAISEKDKLIKILAFGCTEEAMKASREGRGTAIIIFERV
ncbi:tRNA (guanine-N(7)-)-methyltransferase [Cichlidogyrus casuarinus]|uniref:tRNA (guanine-N(7)-)-methyltransferase n=1 Tax=Cichlidogyrus casuarinus TaxID=1844966 RepID=A0ABD2QLX9_9PLAT